MRSNWPYCWVLVAEIQRHGKLRIVRLNKLGDAVSFQPVQRRAGIERTVLKEADWPNVCMPLSTSLTTNGCSTAMRRLVGML